MAEDQVAANSDKIGNCSPIYDFCYLDGAHNWTIDGLSVVLIEKLLRNNGWLPLDDLYWTYAIGSLSPGQGPADLRLSSAERSTPYIASVLNLIVRQRPSFTRFREEDQWGWAQKAADQPRAYELATTTSLKRPRSFVRSGEPKELSTPIAPGSNLASELSDVLLLR